MNCLKCGREISEEEAFCTECLLDAQRYPVDPQAVVVLPRRTSGDTAKKAVRRRTIPMEEQLNILRLRVRNLAIFLIVAVALVLALLFPSVSYLLEDHRLPGQDYRIPTTAETSPATTATVPTETAAE